MKTYRIELRTSHLVQMGGLKVAVDSNRTYYLQADEPTLGRLFAASKSAGWQCTAIPVMLDTVDRIVENFGRHVITDIEYAVG